MDEHNDNVETQQSEAHRAHSNPLAGDSNGSLDGATNGHTDLPTSSSPLTRELVPIAQAREQDTIQAPQEDTSNGASTLRTPSGKLVAQNYALRRTRINRIIMYRHRQERLNRSENATPRVLITAFIIIGILFSLFASGIGAALAYYQVNSPVLSDVANHSLFQSTRIYDRNGQLLYELYDPKYGRRTYVNYTDISMNVINATVAAEDHTFWSNGGLDFQGILRAALADVQSHTTVEGGSTITQQLVKTQFFSDQPRNLQVKGQEAILAYGLTQQYPKWKIMEMYLNTIYYGDLNYGIEAAAQGYFNIQPKCTKTHCIPAAAQLDLAQASLLAGLPQLPTYYDPIINKPAALERQKVILQSMIDLHMVSEKDARQAEAEMARYTFHEYDHGIQAPHFVHYVIDQVLVPMLGAQNLLDGGYNIYTTLDLNLEKKVEQIAYSHLYQEQCDNYLGCYGPLNLQNNVNNAAVVVMNPFNGEILAMDGSANYNDKSPQVQGQYNAAIALRQPGSSFKPVVYSTAFEMGWYPAMILQDHKTIFPTLVAPDPNNPGTPQYYTPPNYDRKYHTGFPMTVRNAIANSFNIPALDAMEFAGIPNVLNMAARLGLTEVATRSPSTLGPSMAIGTAEVSLLHLTGAYATFANRGIRVPQTSILEITDSQGHPLYKYDAQHPYGIRAVGADVAFLMSSILSDKQSRYHEFSPGNPLELDRPAAAKTGTTDSFRDNWTIGYTPYIAVGVWAGNSDNSIMNNVIGITGAGPIWHDVMDFVSNYYHYPPDDFVRPNNVHAGTVSAYTGLLPHPGEPTVTDWFIDGTMPTIYGSYSYTPPCTDNCKPPCHGDNCPPPCRGDNCPPPPGTVPPTTNVPPAPNSNNNHMN